MKGWTQKGLRWTQLGLDLVGMTGVKMLGHTLFRVTGAGEGKHGVCSQYHEPMSDASSMSLGCMLIQRPALQMTTRGLNMLCKMILSVELWKLKCKKLEY